MKRQRLSKSGSEASGIFRERLPPRGDLLTVLATCVFVVHSWSILGILRNLTIWMLHWAPWEMIGLVSYTFLFSLIESLVVFFMLLFLAALLPRRFLRSSFSLRGSMLVMMAALWLGVSHQAFDPQAGRTLWVYALALLGFSATIGLLPLLVLRYERFRRAILSFVDRLSVLAGLYVLLDVLSLGVVFLRNL